MKKIILSVLIFSLSCKDSKDVPEVVFQPQLVAQRIDSDGDYKQFMEVYNAYTVKIQKSLSSLTKNELKELQKKISIDNAEILSQELKLSDENSRFQSSSKLLLSKVYTKYLKDYSREKKIEIFQEVSNLNKNKSLKVQSCSSDWNNCNENVLKAFMLSFFLECLVDLDGNGCNGMPMGLAILVGELKCGLDYANCLADQNG